MYLINAQIVLENKIISKAYLKVVDNLIKEIGLMQQLDVNSVPEQTFDCQNQILFPGFIDTHMHGTNGADFMDSTHQAFDTIAQNAIKEGVTSFLFTTVTSSIENTEKTLKKYSEWTQLLHSSECIGIHLEGPFINGCRKGAHEQKYILDPDIELVKKWHRISNSKIKMITYAVEKASVKFTEELINLNIICSVGHTEADYHQVSAHASAGLNHATHLFNAMKPLSHREPGVIQACLLNPSILCEIITDGIHLSAQTIEMIYQLKKHQKLTIVTDAMSGKNLADGVYKLGELEVVKKGYKATLKNDENLIAGSVSPYNVCVKKMQEILNLSLVELQYITSWNMAMMMGLDSEIGTIKENKKANLILMDKDYNILNAMVNGKFYK